MVKVLMFKRVFHVQSRLANRHALGIKVCPLLWAHDHVFVGSCINDVNEVTNIK